MKLLHDGHEVGEIEEVSQEGVWMNGRIRLNPKGEELRQFFDYMTDEEHGLDEDPPFGPDLLEPENWHVDVNGKRMGIEVPAVHSDGIIEWRWR